MNKQISYLEIFKDLKTTDKTFRKAVSRVESKYLVEAI